MTAFVNLLWRDLWVTLREWPAFLAQTFMQPLFFLFIFGKVLPKIGAAQGGYSTLLLPGIIGLTTMLTAMQAVSLPLTLEFGFTKEIEDRLLSPLPVWMVAIQKIVFAAIRGLTGGGDDLPARSPDPRERLHGEHASISACSGSSRCLVRSVARRSA